MKGIKSFIRKNSKGRWWMDVSDKVLTTKILGEKKKRFCPPHRIPHKFPFFGELIKDEECHIHKTFWRDSHHTHFCKLIGCKNYSSMIKAKRKFKDEAY